MTSDFDRCLKRICIYDTEATLEIIDRMLNRTTHNQKEGKTEK